MPRSPLDFAALFELSPNPYMVLDRRLRYVAANRAYLQLTASRLEDLLGNDIFELFPHDPLDPGNQSRQRLRESFERVLETGRPDTLALIPYRVPLETEKGVVVEDRWWSATHTPILDEGGEVGWILQHTVDVTELHRLKALAGRARDGARVPLNQLEAGLLRRAQDVQQANVALDAERRHLLMLFDQAPGFMCILRGPDHVFELANQAYLQLVGHRPLLGRPVAAALPEVVEQGFIETLDQAFRTGEPVRGRGTSVRLQREPGAPLEERFVDFVYQPVRDEAGRVAGFFVQGHDITEQKLAEAALAESEARLGSLMSALAEGVVFIDASGSIRFVNEAASRLLQLDERRLVGHLLADVSLVLLGEDGGAISIDALPGPRALRSGEVQLGEVIGLRLKSGEVTWLEVNAVPVRRAGEERPEGVVVSFSDITARRRQEEALREAERRRGALLELQALIRQTPAAIAMVDRELRYVVASDRWLEDYGLRGLAIIGRPLHGTFPQLPDPWHRISEDVLQGGEPVSGEDDIVFEPGSNPRRIAWVLRSWTDTSGAPGGLILLTEDVTLRRAAERRALEQVAADATRSALEAERERLSQLVAQFPMGMTLLLEERGELRYVTASARYLEMTGRRREELLGRTPREAFPEVGRQGPQEGPSFFDLVDRVRRTGEPVQGLGVPVRWDADGDGRPELHHVDFTYAPLRGIGGRIDGVVTVTNVVDNRVQAERERQLLLDRAHAARREAEEANRLKDEFLATISHELRTPLSAMLGWAQLLRSGRLPGEDQGRALEAIERNARAQAQLIEDLLDVSRILSGKLRLEVAPVDLSAAAEAAIETVRPAAEAKGIQIQATLDDRDMVMGDVHRLQQVAWNLLSNAVKFTPRGGRVQVVVHRTDSTVRLVVSDTGQGIAPDFLPHVFERFRQAEGGTTRSSGGLGLGLSIVRHLVEMHGGIVRAESEGPGRGARFIVEIPLSPLLRQAGAPPASPNAPATPAGVYCPSELQGMHILVVDDEADNREVLQALLETCGVRVSVAGSAAEALVQLSTTHPDLLLSDIGMPEMDGYSLIQRVRERPAARGGAIPAVALTAYARTENRTRALLAGFDMHIAKPVEPAELLAVLASLVGRRKAR